MDTAFTVTSLSMNKNLGFCTALLLIFPGKRLTQARTLSGVVCTDGNKQTQSAFASWPYWHRAASLKITFGIRTVGQWAAECYLASSQLVLLHVFRHVGQIPHPRFPGRCVMDEMSSEIWGWGEVRWQQGMGRKKRKFIPFCYYFTVPEKVKIARGRKQSLIWLLGLGSACPFCSFSFDSKCWELKVILWEGEKHLNGFTGGTWRHTLHSTLPRGQVSPIILLWPDRDDLYDSASLIASCCKAL